MTTTSLFSHADLQRHLTWADGDEAMAPADAHEIIGILVGLMDAGQTLTFAIVDGELTFVSDPAALEDAACAGALVLAATEEGVTVDVLGDPWADFSTALLPYLEQESVTVTLDAGAIMKLQDTNLDAGVLSGAGQSPDIAWSTGDWNRDGEEDVVVGFGSAEGLTPVLAFTGGVRVATGDVNGDGTPDLVATTAAGDQFVFADHSITLIHDGEATEIWSAFGGGLWNESQRNFEEKLGEEEVYFTGDVVEGQDWFTATDDLWL